MMEVEKIDKQIEDFQNSIKKDDAKIYQMLKGAFDDGEVKQFINTLMTNKSPQIRTQDNPQFSIAHNKELDCFDFTFKKINYSGEEMQSMASFIYTMGKYTDDKVRFGSVVEIVEKPKIILQ